jgi:7,8-dihydropterin-6-yl-methyl-4-(beta-D-ribofuranosyl)aminobenzene 5'-phosphate synthase
MPESTPLARLEPIDALTITTLIDNSVDVFLPDQGPAKRWGLSGMQTSRVQAGLMQEGAVPDGLRAEHGFSALLTMEKDGRTRRILFDTGVSPDGMTENMRRLQLAPKDVEAIVFSHGHFDHTTGLDGFVRAVGRANMPVYLHPEFWNRRRMTMPGRDPFEMPTASKSALAGAGFEIIEARQPSFLLDRSLLITGEVARTTPFERGLPPQEKREGDRWVPDPLTLDEQAVVAHIRGRGLVVLAGCGHAGIVNMVRYARVLTGVEQVYAVIGGFHLGGPLFEPIIPDVVSALAAFAPEAILPAHCTGWRAMHALAQALPGAFIPNSIGTRLELRAAGA